MSKHIEQYLARMMGVSRQTINRALRSLAEQNTIVVEELAALQASPGMF